MDYTMNETVRCWFLGMLHKELSEVDHDLDNNLEWRKTCVDADEAFMLKDCADNLNSYKQLLLILQNKVEEGTFNV